MAVTAAILFSSCERRRLHGASGTCTGRIIDKSFTLSIIWLKGLESEEPEDHAPVSHSPVQIFHHLCPHYNVVQGYEVEEKDSLDEHLDALTRKLADKEGRLRISKSKIRETQNEIENLHAIDHDVKNRYREIMESLRTDLMTNEKECKKLQEQIEWVSRRRAELKDEVHHGQLLYGEAAAELASNLSDLQRGRMPEQKIMEKPIQHSPSYLRCRKEPYLPRATPVCSFMTKNPLHMSNTTTNTSHAMLME